MARYTHNPLDSDDPLDSNDPHPPKLLIQSIDTPLGPMVGMVAVQNDLESLCLLEFNDRPILTQEYAALAKAFGSEPEHGRAVLHDLVESQLHAYFAGALTEFDIPLTTPGTDFQQRVWAALCEIPFGKTCSYGTLATRVGSSGGARAVGAANGANRVAIVIPCHRVIDASGKLHGYGGGLARKQKLLALEGIDIDLPSHSTPLLFTTPEKKAEHTL